MGAHRFRAFSAPMPLALSSSRRPPPPPPPDSTPPHPPQNMQAGYERDTDDYGRMMEVKNGGSGAGQDLSEVAGITHVGETNSLPGSMDPSGVEDNSITRKQDSTGVCAVLGSESEDLQQGSGRRSDDTVREMSFNGQAGSGSDGTSPPPVVDADMSVDNIARMWVFDDGGVGSVDGLQDSPALVDPQDAVDAASAVKEFKDRLEEDVMVMEVSWWRDACRCTRTPVVKTIFAR